MQLAPLDNQVIFKKAFTDKFVFEKFVKDILNIDFQAGTIETEKQFEPPIGYVKFILDIYAESIDKRICIEIQRIEYDSHFDRFLHSFLMIIAEQQKTAKSYNINQTVYMIVVLTEKYTINEKNGQPIRDELLLLNINPQTIDGEWRDLFGHTLVFLNPNYPDTKTPPLIRDWTDLIYQSIHNSSNPKINLANEGIKKAVELIENDNLTIEERTESKKKESGRIKIALTTENAKNEGILEGEQIGLQKGEQIGIQKGKLETQTEGIIKALKNGKLSVIDIADVFEVSTDFVLKIKSDHGL